MIAISRASYNDYGCPHCGCASGYLGGMYGQGTFPTTCRECRNEFVVLADSMKQSSFGFGTDKKDADGNTIFVRPKLEVHPRAGIPAHEWVQPDIRPEYGEYWKPRGIGYDLSGFVKSKAAGERILKMVKDVLGVDKPESWLDYRPREPEWIQFKFQGSEFDLNKLMDLVTKNNGIITKEIIEESVLLKNNTYLMGIYKYFTGYKEFEVQAYSKESALKKAKEYVGTHIEYDDGNYNKKDIRCIKKLNEKV